MGYFTSDRFLHPRFRNIATAAIILVCTALEIYIHGYLGQATGYSHFFYIFLVVMAILHHRGAVFFGLYLSVLHLGIEYLTTGAIGDISAYQRVVGFILVPLLAGYFFEQIEREHGDLIEYLTDRAISRETGGHAEGGGLTAAGATVQSMKHSGNVGGLIAALGNRDVEMRYRAAIALGDLADPAAVDALAGALKDENSGVRWEAAEALGKIGRPAVDVLIASLADDDDDIRWRAAIALGDIPDAAVVPPLIGALADEDAYVRKRAALSLARIGDPAVEPLVAALKEGRPEISECAAIALARMEGDAEAHVAAALEGAGDEVKSAVEKAITIKRIRDQKREEQPA